jgi:hypothetical protein
LIVQHAGISIAALDRQGGHVALTKTGVLIGALITGVLASHTADAQLITSADGLTVYDNRLHVVWLSNANLAGTPEGAQFN